MEDRLKRQEGESDKKYIVRMYRNKDEYDLTNKEVYSIICQQLGLNIAESSLRCKYASYIEGYDDALVEGVSDNEILNEIELKTQELEKEKIKFQDQKREYRKLLRLDARWEHLKDSIIKEIKDLDNVKLLENPNIHMSETEDKVKEACLMLADWHTGLEVDNYWNVFNLEILQKRVNKLLAKTVEYCIDNNVNVLHVEILGDMVMGLIHVTSKIFSEEDTIKQVKIVSEMLSEFLCELSKYIPNIKVYTTSGNHGRCTANKKEEIDTENFENLISWYLQARLQNINNIKFIENKYDNEIITYKILNETIFSVHGHRESLNKVVDDLSQMLKIFPDEIHMGHFHKDYQTEKHDISIIVNGCMSGVDQYAKTKRLTGKPHQKLIIYTEEGQECIYKIKL